MGEPESTPESTRVQTLSPRRRSESSCRDVDAPEPMAPRRRRPPPTEQVIRHAGGSIRQILVRQVRQSQPRQATTCRRCLMEASLHSGTCRGNVIPPHSPTPRRDAESGSGEHSCDRACFIFFLLTGLSILGDRTVFW